MIVYALTAMLLVAQQRPLEAILPDFEKLVGELKKLVAATDPTIIDVPSGGNLQAALDSAPDGATVRLAAAGTYTWNFVVRRGNLTVTTSATLPDRRLTLADRPLLATLTAPSGSVMVSSGSNLTFRGILFTGPSNDVVDCQSGDNVRFDRVIILGDGVRSAKRGLAAQCGGGIVRSHIGEIWLSGQDSSGIGSWNSALPFEVRDNYIEAGAEPILLGGARASVPGTIPTDWTIVGNTLTRPLAWKALNRGAKNLFEIKAGRRITLRDNLLENNWNQAQPGWAIVITPAEDGVGCGDPAITIEDVTLEDNVVRNTQGGINLLGLSQECGPQRRTTNLTIRRNYFQIDRLFSGAPAGQGWFMQCNRGPRDVVVERNTVVMNGNQIFSCGGEPVTGWRIAGNAFQTPGLYGFFLEVAGSNRPNAQRWAEFFLGGTISGNAFVGSNSTLRANLPGNFHPTVAEVAGLIDAEGFTSGALAPYGRPR